MYAGTRAYPSLDSLDHADRALADGVLARQPRAVAKAITLIESTRRDHNARAERLLEALLPHTGSSYRIGISGTPGAGKSTFIEAFGLFLTGRGHRVAVLAVDPSSALSGGSILGDKTRMERLACDPNAFIRPSPSGGTLGGVAHKTREALAICEAAGFDVVLVETVGVGQSETAVAGITDLFVLLALPNAGDDLQAIKRGIIELVDLVLVNKSDIDLNAAELARAQLAGAFSLVHGRDRWWTPPVLKVSAATGAGIDLFWKEAERYRANATANGAFTARRQRQALTWMNAIVEHELRRQFQQHPAVRAELGKVEAAVSSGAMTAPVAAARLLALAGREAR
jgi:LAO/AO transport system kinase